MTNKNKSQISVKDAGFTLIELIVVIAVMGILATIVLLNYGKWQDSIAIANLKSDLNGAAAAMENSRTYSNSYPESPPPSFKSSNGIVVSGGSMDAGNTYCLSAQNTKTGVSYYITSDNKVPQVGACVLNQTLVSSNKNINTNSLKTGRTCADAASYSVVSLSTNNATLSGVPVSGCLKANDEVLLINLQGTSTNYANVGNFETLIIASDVTTNTVTFTANKVKKYGDLSSNDSNLGISTSNQRVMLQRLPNYTNFAVKSGVTLTANAWDGIKGGVLAVRASDSADISGTIDMSGKGWHGGLGAYWYGGAGESYNGGPTSIDSSSSMSANGGGGGGGGSAGLVDGQTGGAGGAAYASNGTNGGSGRYTPTIGYGAASYGSSDLSKIYFGSGGGGNSVIDGGDSNSGGAGGGIVIIFCGSSFSVGTNGSVLANGSDGYVGTHQSSGGSGGSIYIVGPTASIGSNKVLSNPGASGTGIHIPPNPGQSGPSSSGRIRITGTLTGTSTPTAYNG